MAKYIGDRPTWLLTNQRWDNIDPNAVVSLVHQSLVRMWGNLVGPTWGCLTRPTFDTTNYLTNGNHVAISACVFGYVWESLESGAQDLEGGPVICDPSRDIQAESTVYIPPAYASEGVWLWFKRFDGPAETDMRAYRPGATEDVAATATQYKEYVQFEALPLSAMPSTTINEDQGWFRFARLPAAADDGWTAGVPDGIQPLSFWDGWYTKRGTGTAFTALNTFGKFMYDPPDANATSNTRHGLAQVLQAILNQLAIILDTTNIRDNETEAHTALTTETADSQWHDRPARGLTQLSADLATIEAADLDTRLTAAEADITALQVLQPIYACTIATDGTVSSERFSTPSSPLSGTPVWGAGICTITFNSGLGTGLKVDNTSIPQVTNRDSETRISAYWDSQYVLIVKGHPYNTTGNIAVPFYLTINGSYV